MTRLLPFFAGFACGGILARVGSPITRFTVADYSMAPALLPGDRLFVLRWTWISGLRSGDVVVTHDPTNTPSFLVKRLALSSPGGYVLLGDNAAASRDSRAFGPVPLHLLIGRVLWRYLPASRRGPLPPSPLVEPT